VAVGVHSYVTIVERVKVVRGAWMYYQVLEFQDSILNGTISFVEGENGTHTRVPHQVVTSNFPMSLTQTIVCRMTNRLKKNLVYLILAEAAQSTLLLEQGQTGQGLVLQTYSAN
jgi:hypothetical protein